MTVVLAEPEAGERRSSASFARDARAAERDRSAELRDADGRARDLLPPVAGASDDRLLIGLREAAARDRESSRADRESAAADRRASAAELVMEGFDALTMTLRRGVGLAAIEREIRRVERDGGPLVVCFVDVDGLKAVNDGAGHLAGDRLLQAVATGLMNHLRPHDVVVRYGGDELVCAVAGQTLEGVRARLASVAADLAAGHAGASFSVGCAQHRAGDGLQDLLLRSNAAMRASRPATVR